MHIKTLQKKATLCVRLFFVSFLFVQSVFAQSDKETAFHYYLDFKLDSCEFQINQIKDQAYSIYLESLIESTKIFLSDDIEIYKSRKDRESDLLTKVVQSEHNDATIHFLQSEIKIQWAILGMKYGDEFSAFWNLRQAYSQTQKNIENYPEYLPSQKTIGLLQVLFGIVPDKYNWILNIFGIEGDAAKGFDSLKKISESQTEYALESRIMAALLQTYLLSEPEAGLEIITKIHTNQKYLLIDYAYCLIAMKNAKSELALEVVEVAEQYQQPFKLPQLYYVLGEIFLQKGELDKAISNYQLFIKHQSGLSLIKDAYYKIGICYLIEGKTKLSSKNFELASENGWAKNEADNYAQIQIEKRDFSHNNLYRLRYATDGGYYENALKIQSQISQVNLQGRILCEYYYRSARLIQKTGKLEVAIEYYQKTIEAQKDNPWYYAPNAALQLGTIYISLNDNENSGKYLESVFNFKNHPYQKSIRQKAKTLLKTLD